MHTKRKGDIAELVVAQHFLAEGYRVLFPYGELTRYDLVAEKHGKFLRIQVKYVTPKNDTLSINCKSSNNWSTRQYTSQEIDIIAVVNGQSKEIYFIPIEQVAKSILVLRLGTTKNGQSKGINLAKSFVKIPA